jgi:hypothetical protein
VAFWTTKYHSANSGDYFRIEIKPSASGLCLDINGVAKITSALAEGFYNSTF